MPEPIQVKIKQSQLRKFQRWAKSYFPREILSVMLGEGDVSEFKVLYITPPYVGTRDYVEYDDPMRMAKEFGKYNGLKMLGTIHTHPEMDGTPSLSTSDVHSASHERERVYAVCNVWRDKGKFRTNTQFYTSGPEVQIQRI